jgi:hypothetical protein
MLNYDHTDPFLDIMVQNLFELYSHKDIRFDARTKFDSLETILNNKHLSKETKDRFFSEFHQSQNLFWKLTKFICRCKNRTKDHRCYTV